MSTDDTMAPTITAAPGAVRFRPVLSRCPMFSPDGAWSWSGDRGSWQCRQIGDGAGQAPSGSNSPGGAGGRSPESRQLARNRAGCVRALGRDSAPFPARRRRHASTTGGWSALLRSFTAWVISRLHPASISQGKTTVDRSDPKTTRDKGPDELRLRYLNERRWRSGRAFAKANAALGSCACACDRSTGRMMATGIKAPKDSP